jgi:hypothetical protein
VTIMIISSLATSPLGSCRFKYRRLPPGRCRQAACHFSGWAFMVS